MGWWLLRLSAKILALLRPGRDIHYNRNGRFHPRDGLFV